jgi:hypothetical protein
MAIPVYVLCYMDISISSTALHRRQSNIFEGVFNTLEQAQASARAHFSNNAHDITNDFADENDAQDAVMSDRWVQDTPTTWVCEVSCEVDGKDESETCVWNFYTILQRFVD